MLAQIAANRIQDFGIIVDGKDYWLGHTALNTQGGRQ